MFVITREITDISILEQFIHLRYVDLTKNSIKDITPLNSLTQVSTYMYLQVSNGFIDKCVINLFSKELWYRKVAG